MGGIGSYWLSLTQDSMDSPRWRDAYRSFDIVQPWTVGRYRNSTEVDKWRDSHLHEDLEATKAQSQMYMPVIFPGFSWHNRHTGATKNEIKRDAGNLLWQQAVNAKLSGSSVVKIAMFDELNEATAIFKVATSSSLTPKASDMVTLDSEGVNLPLRLVSPDRPRD